MNKNKIISILFILVLFYFPLHATYLYIPAHLKIERTNTTTLKKIDWERLYPFSNTIKGEKKNIIETLNNQIMRKINHIEKKFDSYFPNKYKLCEFQMFFDKFCGKKLFLEYDGLVVLNNGYLDYWHKYKNCKEALEQTTKLVDFLKNIDSDFVFVLYPSKNSKYDNQLPIGLNDNNNVSCDYFIQELNKRNIKTLDLRENAKKDYKSQYEMFFKTDHHWKPSTGLWASNQICKYLNEKFNWNINTSLLDKEKFKTTTLPSFFFGSQGKKITLAYIKPDDFDIIEPIYNTNFQRFSPQWGDASGTFNDVIFSENHLEKCDYYINNDYCYYLYGDLSYLRLINFSDYAYNKKVLLIRDSFNCVVSPYLALCFKDLTMLDTRHFTGSVKNLLLKEKFDLVLIGYNANCIVTNGENNTKFKFK